MKQVHSFAAKAFVCFCFLHFTLVVAATPLKEGDASADSTECHLPVIGLGYGALTFIGDVGNTALNKPFYYHGGFQVDAQLQSKYNYEFFFHFLVGKTYGEEKSVDKNVNFSSNIMMLGANARYVFKFKKYPDQILFPFVSLGIEGMTFDPSTDLKDANGNTYYYWADGTIRNIAETASDANLSKPLNRDYTYETNIHDANVNNVGSFSQFSLAVPISIGVKFKVTESVGLYFTETYHYAFTKYIDGNIGGGSGNNKVLYSAVSLHYDLSGPRETHVSKGADPTLYNNVNYDDLQRADSDGDGVPDMIDEDNSTPLGAKVDAQGRALDSDADGVPDYRDKEPNSPSSTLVDESGVTVTDSSQEAKYIRDSLYIQEMAKNPERVITKTEGAENEAGGGKSKLPDEFKSVDTDHDGVISADEIAKAIELYTTGKSPFPKTQFYRLVDYFFSQ